MGNICCLSESPSFSREDAFLFSPSFLAELGRSRQPALSNGSCYISPALAPLFRPSLTLFFLERLDRERPFPACGLPGNRLALFFFDLPLPSGFAAASREFWFLKHNVFAMFLIWILNYGEGKVYRTWGQVLPSSTRSWFIYHLISIVATEKFKNVLASSSYSHLSGLLKVVFISFFKFLQAARKVFSLSW